ncbi:hypothetical protein PFICI_14252 [Pestalotiopsis fici W106-1]|uniref:Xaa-Pro dipeptidyl-peptidase C-terminal domain-containing protein n=1 Tax=Pestalotiopsis fici (strain W106-1 / CGMCC3.15140) TaxID=1229662 RepID=W3WNJ3_PESFW|nr:uncharacterized protein PFICI_14252 [Pestalotiopsis fici W106-1]ETS74386.1 hypothetical protein PFICI_14252 [Pestalotiopsis fici W106-1]
MSVPKDLQFPDLKFVKLSPPAVHPLFRYNGFRPERTVLAKGHMRAPGRKAFPINVIYDRDVTITLSDGTRIYADVFRPANDSSRVPALIPWSAYGKTGTGPQQYDTMGPFRSGIPLERTSGYEKFEAPDPAEWCARGYAVINIDARGAGMSEGNIRWWGEQDARDIYDTIDWLSKQSWCNGSVGMVGNSWLATSQLNFAARLKHPALKALAPLEGLTDAYRDLIVRGGMPHNPKFHKRMMTGFAGMNYMEDMPSMYKLRPLFDDYWASKRVHPEKIDLPMYILASYSTGLHSRGSFETFRTAGSAQKWLRVHPYQEWYDLYREDVNEDLQRFFDRYCKFLDNGWERDTPPVRLSLLGFEKSPAKTVVERPEQEYPLARQHYETYHLDVATRTLTTERLDEISRASYEAHSLNDTLDFTLYFAKDTELIGYSKVSIWMSCAEMGDLDVVVQIRKISAKGELLEHLNYPCPVPVEQVPNTNIVKFLGPQGLLRASHIVSKDEENSTDVEIIYKHDKLKAIEPGSMVKLEITLWPIGMVFAKGEGIMLRVAGHDLSYPEVEDVTKVEPDDENVGRHIVYTGGEFDSTLTIPVVHPKE